MTILSSSNPWATQLSQPRLLPSLSFNQVPNADSLHSWASAWFASSFVSLSLTQDILFVPFFPSSLSHFNLPYIDGEKSTSTISKIKQTFSNCFPLCTREIQLLKWYTCSLKNWPMGLSNFVSLTNHTLKVSNTIFCRMLSCWDWGLVPLSLYTPLCLCGHPLIVCVL